MVNSRMTVVAVALALAGGVGAAIGQSSAPARSAGTHPLVTQTEYEKWQTELSNWGRWGKDDELGALNLITPAKRKQAANLVKDGGTVSLAREIMTEKDVDVPCPVEWAMTRATETLAMDRLNYACIHGANITHLDSFAHVFFGGKMWNGYPVKELVTQEKGALRNSVFTMKDGIVTRGVLYDMARLKGVDYLEPGTRIYAEDLEAWEKKTGVKAGSGDALIMRWGRWTRRTKLGAFDISRNAVGFDLSVIPWMKKRDIAILGWETPNYAPKPEGDTISGDPFHNFVLTMLGVHLLDRCDLDAVAEAAAARNRWEFMLTVAPAPIRNGTGSPINPIAIF